MKLHISTLFFTFISLQNTLLSTWKATWESDQNRSALSDLYDLLLSTWHSQVKWCAQVFNDPVTVVLELISQTLGSLEPSLSVVFNTLVGETLSPLDMLIELKEVCSLYEIIFLHLEISSSDILNLRLIVDVNNMFI